MESENKINIDVSIIIVNYKTSDLVHQIIKSICDKSNGFSCEVIVVDNSESQEEFNKLSDLADKGAILIDAKANLGFGKANNLGTTYAKGKYLYFLNSDTLLMNNAIYELKKFLDEHPDTGIVGANLYTKDRKPNFSFSEQEKNLKTDKSSLLKELKQKIFHKYSYFNFSNEPLLVKGFISGATLMIRRELFARVGGFDKDIFMYGEDALLCRECLKLGAKIYNIPSAKIIHLEGASANSESTGRRFRMSMDGEYIYYKKSFGEESGLKYLRMKERYFKKKYNLSKFIAPKKSENLKAIYEAYDRKIEEVLRQL